MIWWSFLLVVFLVLLLLAMAPFQLRVKFVNSELRGVFSVCIYLGSWCLYTINKSFVGNDIISTLEDFLLRLVHNEQSINGQWTNIDFYHLLNNFISGLGSPFRKLFEFFFVGENNLLRNSSCQKFKWITKVGIANPAITGISAGLLWGIKYGLYHHFIKSRANMNNIPVIKVIPEFFDAKIEIEFHCIFVFRGGHIITGVLQNWLWQLYSLLREVKLWQIIQSKG